jgi:antitoxin CptB
MTDKELTKKKIIYRSNHRGFKEMDMLLGKFVNKYIEKFDINELNELNELLSIEDEILYKWYFENKSNKSIPKSNMSTMLKNFKL